MYSHFVSIPVHIMFLVYSVSLEYAERWNESREKNSTNEVEICSWILSLAFQTYVLHSPQFPTHFFAAFMHTVFAAVGASVENRRWKNENVLKGMLAKCPNGSAARVLVMREIQFVQPFVTISRLSLSAHGHLHLWWINVRRWRYNAHYLL